MNKKKDYERFLKNLMELAEIYEKTLSERMIKIYWKVLKDLFIEDFEMNCISVLKNRVFTSFPLPADLRNCEENAEAEANMKWLEVLEAEYYNSHDFGGVTNAVINRGMGGFCKFKTEVETELIQVMKNNFIVYYKLFKKNKSSDDFVKGKWEESWNEMELLKNIERGFLTGAEIHRRKQLEDKTGEPPIALAKKKDASQILK